MQKNGIIALVIVGVMVLAGCVGVGVLLVSDDGETHSRETGKLSGPSEAPSVPTDDVPAALLSFYTQDLAWAKCGSNDCAELEVPIDYQKPDAGTMKIAVERAAATGDRIGSLVVNPGGPGAPGTDMATQAESYFDQRLLSAYDIIGFDPRGTGDSSPVDCLSDSEMDAYIAQDPAPDSAAEEADALAESKRFWRGCEEKSGDIAAHVSTVEAARDMDVLRAVLGEETLPYFGFSYGTRLGATYAELFPDKVGRFVLDGAVDPELSTYDGSLSQAKGFETALRSYVQDCVDGDSCFLGDTVDAGLATISDLLDDIDAKPLPTDDERDLQIGNAFYGLILPLYAKDNWSLLDQGLQDALDGDGTMLLFLSDFYGSRENGRYVDNSLEAIAVINCLDDPWSIAPKKVPKQFPAFEKASPTFGDVFAWGLTGCRGIPFASTDEPDLKIDGSGAAPIVVVGTTRDPATPYDEAVRMAEELESGVLLSRDGDGHTAYNRGNKCIDDAIDGYLIDGVVPEDGLKC